MSRAILVIEDDDIVRDFVVRALKSEGHDVMTAASVGAAREIIFARPDADALCLVIDVVLKHESGIEFAQELIKRYPGFRVLLISGFTDDVLMTEPDDVLERMNFLAKPFTKKELVAAVEDLCR
jgi:two-component system response regulator PilR (NtrC family)